MSVRTPPPVNETELMHRAYTIAGLTLFELAQQLNVTIPENLLRHKGWVGMLLEHALGADANSKPIPDFSQLGIELKTIPIDRNGKPLETTFVCFAPLTELQGITWETSGLKLKLQRVLWVPIEGSREIPLKDRRIGTPILWSPSKEEEMLLRSDWQELMDLIVLGEVQQITAHHGQVLQLRPKAANSRVVTSAYNTHGHLIQTNPRGFYLKTAFTKNILDNYFLTP